MLPRKQQVYKFYQLESYVHTSTINVIFYNKYFIYLILGNSKSKPTTQIAGNRTAASFSEVRTQKLNKCSES